MNSDVVKRGDTHQIKIKVNADLTGATNLKVLAKRRGTVIDLSEQSEFGDRALGEVIHTLTGDLVVGRYEIEIEFTDVQGEVHTAPSEGYAELWVYQDLG